MQVFSVGITDEINEEELRGISSNPQREGENYFKSVDFRSLNSIQGAIVRQTCRVGGGSNDIQVNGLREYNLLNKLKIYSLNLS